MPANAASDFRRDLEQRLVLKAWRDPEFKRDVIRNPKEMFQEFLGQPLPENLKIVVHEETENSLHLSIPPTPAAVTELSDSDLEKVAGGTEFFIIASLIASATAAATAVGSVAGVTKTNGGW